MSGNRLKSGGRRPIRSLAPRAPARPRARRECLSGRGQAGLGYNTRPRQPGGLSIDDNGATTARTRAGDTLAVAALAMTSCRQHRRPAWPGAHLLIAGDAPSASRRRGGRWARSTPARRDLAAVGTSDLGAGTTSSLHLAVRQPLIVVMKRATRRPCPGARRCAQRAVRGRDPARSLSSGQQPGLQRHPPAALRRHDARRCTPSDRARLRAPGDAALLPSQRRRADAACATRDGREATRRPRHARFCILRARQGGCPTARQQRLPSTIKQRLPPSNLHCVRHLLLLVARGVTAQGRARPGLRVLAAGAHAPGACAADLVERRRGPRVRALLAATLPPL